jgi:hypothetical protein
MAITSIKTGSSFTNLQKYNDFLGPNSAYIPPSFESIATASPTSGSTVSFTSIPSTYKSLQIRVAVITPSTANPSLNITYNSDSGSNYTLHQLRGNSTDAAALGSAPRTNFSLSNYSGMTVNNPNVAIVDIVDYASTTKYKTTRAFYGQNLNSSSIYNNVILVSGLWLSTSAINSITFTVSGGESFGAGTLISLYGIKGA